MGRRTGDWGLGAGDWGLGTGDWGLGTGDWGLRTRTPYAVVALLLLVLVAAVGGGAAYVISERAGEPFRGYTDNERLVDIPAGTSAPGIGERLVAAGVVRDALAFRVALWLSGQARALKAGEYRFDRPMSAREVLDKIARGDVHVVPITFREGLTIVETAEVFASSGLGSAEAFHAAATNAALIRDLDSGATDLEGYLFPETYTLPRKMTAERLVERMVAQFRQVVTDELQGEAKARGLSVRQLVTLASLIEMETAKADERPTVSAVYTNRLRIGMGLQCDPTVIYALQRAGKFTGNLRRADLQFDSPDNTYRYPGLPPGPIAAPGKASLEAAARPAPVDYVYFVSRNDGSHAFARTLAEHNRNVQRWQVEYFRDKRNLQFTIRN